MNFKVAFKAGVMQIEIFDSIRSIQIKMKTTILLNLTKKKMNLLIMKIKLKSFAQKYIKILKN